MIRRKLGHIRTTYSQLASHHVPSNVGARQQDMLHSAVAQRRTQSLGYILLWHEIGRGAMFSERAGGSRTDRGDTRQTAGAPGALHLREPRGEGSDAVGAGK